MTGQAGPRIEGTAREALRARLRALGFDEVRFAAAEAEAGAGLRDWLAAGLHADMAWMERTAEKRAQAGLVLPGVRSVILLGLNYWSNGLGVKNHGSRPVWARYALHEDYHDTMKPGLVAAGRVLEELAGVTAADYRYYVDTGPVLERGWAARSGLGFTGKNAMLISKQHGNWLFLASILTRVELAPDEPVRTSRRPGGRRRPALRQMHALPRRVSDQAPSPRPAWWMRGAASPTRRSRTRASSRASCARASARMSTAATSAWRCARGTGSRRPAATCCWRRVMICRN
jgi:epoxyqueuosine reductase